MIDPGPVHRVRLAAIRQLSAAGVPSPEHDATELLAAVLGVRRALLPLADGVDDDQARRYAALVGRRAAREPLQHILQEAGFYGLTLAVGPGVFIPRPETELLVEHARGVIEGVPQPRVLDLCAGSGAIAIAIAVHRADAQVTAVERSAEAITWLRRNVDQHAPRVRIVQADVLDADDYGGEFDLVTCNPPYVPQRDDLDPEVLEHDPAEAVFSGADGLDLIRALVPRIARLLRPGGITLIEHDEAHQPEVLSLLRADGRFAAACGLCDLTGRPRFVRATRSSDEQ